MEQENIGNIDAGNVIEKSSHLEGGDTFRVVRRTDGKDVPVDFGGGLKYNFVNGGHANIPTIIANQITKVDKKTGEQKFEDMGSFKVMSHLTIVK